MRGEEVRGWTLRSSKQLLDKYWAEKTLLSHSVEHATVSVIDAHDRAVKKERDGVLD